MLLLVALIALVALSGAMMPGVANAPGFVAVQLSPASLGGLVAWLALAVAAGLIVAAVGNVMAGAALLAAAMLGPAASGGAIEAWLRTHADPGRYMLLALDAMAWALPFAAMVLIAHCGRDRLRHMLPAWLRAAHYQELAEGEQPPPFQSAAAAGPVLLSAAVVFMLKRSLTVDYIATLLIGLCLLTLAWLAALVGRMVMERGAGGLQWRTPVASSFLGGVVAMAVGSAIAMILLASADSGQVIGGLLVAFTVAGLVGHQMFPTRTRLTFIVAPLLLAVAAYGWTATTVADADELLHRLFQPNAAGGNTPLLPLALALPAHYASAGVLGSLLGVGWSQSLHAANQKHVTVVDA